MENKKTQKLSIAALIISILPLATIYPCFIQYISARRSAFCLGGGKYSFCYCRSNPVHSMRKKPQ